MFVCHGLMMFIIIRLFTQCIKDSIKTDEEKTYKNISETWAELPRLEQASKLFDIKRNHFKRNKEFELSPELYKFCSKINKEPNKIRFGRYKPKAHQSWVIIRDKHCSREGYMYTLPLDPTQFNEIIDRVKDITEISI
jgi:hypothetical protein